MRFAIFIIAVLATVLAAGSLVEVKYGHIIADYYIYDSLAFSVIIFFILLSLLFSMLMRPFVKKLYGFFLIHIGLIILSIGALQSKFMAQEGLVSLYPLKNSQIIETEEFELQVHKKGESSIKVSMPELISPYNLNRKVSSLLVKKWIPFSKQVSVIEDKNKSYVIKLELFNENLHKELTLTSDITSSFYKQSESLGPLSIISFNTGIDSCIKNTGYILIDSKLNTCTNFEEKSKRLFKIDYKGAQLRFAPEFSNYPLTDKGEEIIDSPYQLLSMKKMISTPTLWINHKYIYFFDKKLVKTTKEEVKLPWMGFEININRYRNKTIKTSYAESKDYSAYRPAVSFEFKGALHWADLSNSVLLEKELLVQLKKKQIKLPFSLTLLNFKLDQDFGTGRDAGYTTSIEFRSQSDNFKQDITLNNPMKYDVFTIYQDSYKKLVGNKYLSVLRINVDGGRVFKYLGWIIALIGMIWHFSIRRLKL